MRLDRRIGAEVEDREAAARRRDLESLRPAVRTEGEREHRELVREGHRVGARKRDARVLRAVGHAGRPVRRRRPVAARGVGPRRVARRGVRRGRAADDGEESRDQRAGKEARERAREPACRAKEEIERCSIGPPEIPVRTPRGPAPSTRPWLGMRIVGGKASRAIGPMSTRVTRNESRSSLSDPRSAHDAVWVGWSDL